MNIFERARGAVRTIEAAVNRRDTFTEGMLAAIEIIEEDWAAAVKAAPDAPAVSLGPEVKA